MISASTRPEGNRHRDAYSIHDTWRRFPAVISLVAASCSGQHGVIIPMACPMIGVEMDDQVELVFTPKRVKILLVYVGPGTSVRCPRPASFSSAVRCHFGTLFTAKIVS